MRKQLWILGAALALGACGAEDERPADVGYLTDAIFRPSCGTASCHSTAAQTGPLEPIVLDTVEGVCGVFNTSNPYLDSGGLADLLTTGNDYERMPADGPLPEADIQLIEDWFDGVLVGANTDCP